MLATDRSSLRDPVVVNIATPRVNVVDLPAIPFLPDMERKAETFLTATRAAARRHGYTEEESAGDVAVVQFTRDLQLVAQVKGSTSRPLASGRDRVDVFYASRTVVTHFLMNATHAVKVRAVGPTQLVRASEAPERAPMLFRNVSNDDLDEIFGGALGDAARDGSATMTEVDTARAGVAGAAAALRSREEDRDLLFAHLAFAEARGRRPGIAQDWALATLTVRTLLVDERCRLGVELHSGGWPVAQRIVEGSPADLAGLLPGDAFVSVSVPVRNWMSVGILKPPGRDAFVRLGILRSGRRLDFFLPTELGVLGVAPTNPTKKGPPTLVPASKEGNDPTDSAAARAGVEEGDVLESMSVPVFSAEHLAAMEQAFVPFMSVTVAVLRLS
jgi:hypothetical protein